MESALIFIAGLVAATLGILIALYAAARGDAKPNHQDAPFSLYRQPAGPDGQTRIPERL
jgi:hypothetical protein